MKKKFCRPFTSFLAVAVVIACLGASVFAEWDLPTDTAVLPGVEERTPDLEQPDGDSSAEETPPDDSESEASSEGAASEAGDSSESGEIPEEDPSSSETSSEEESAPASSDVDGREPASSSSAPDSSEEAAPIHQPGCTLAPDHEGTCETGTADSHPTAEPSEPLGNAQAETPVSLAVLPEEEPLPVTLIHGGEETSYATLEEAVEHSADGDRILLAAGEVYAPSRTLSIAHSLTIEGTGDSEELPVIAGSALFTCEADGQTIAFQNLHFSVDEGSTWVIYLNGSGSTVSVDGCTFTLADGADYGFNLVLNETGASGRILFRDNLVDMLCVAPVVGAGNGSVITGNEFHIGAEQASGWRTEVISVTAGVNGEVTISDNWFLGANRAISVNHSTMPGSGLTCKNNRFLDTRYAFELGSEANRGCGQYDLSENYYRFDDAVSAPRVQDADADGALYSGAQAVVFPYYLDEDLQELSDAADSSLVAVAKPAVSRIEIGSVPETLRELVQRSVNEMVQNEAVSTTPPCGLVDAITGLPATGDLQVSVIPAIEEIRATQVPGANGQKEPVITAVVFEAKAYYQPEGSLEGPWVISTRYLRQRNVTFRLPIPTAFDAKYARVEHRSDRDGSTATSYLDILTSPAGNARYILVSADSFGTFTLTPTNRKPSTSHSGGSAQPSAANTEYEFWMEVKDRIDNAADGNTLYVQAGNWNHVSSAVLQALYGRDLSLTISYGRSSELTLKGEELDRVDDGRIYYTIAELIERYKAPAAEDATSSQSTAPVTVPTFTGTVTTSASSESSSSQASPSSSAAPAPSSSDSAAPTVASGQPTPAEPELEIPFWVMIAAPLAAVLLVVLISLLVAHRRKKAKQENPLPPYPLSPTEFSSSTDGAAAETQPDSTKPTEDNPWN